MDLVDSPGEIHIPIRTIEGKSPRKARVAYQYRELFAPCHGCAKLEAGYPSAILEREEDLVPFLLNLIQVCLWEQLSLKKCPK